MRRGSPSTTPARVPTSKKLLGNCRKSDAGAPYIEVGSPFHRQGEGCALSARFPVGPHMRRLSSRPKLSPVSDLARALDVWNPFTSAIRLLQG